MPSWNPAGSYDPNKFYTETTDKTGRGDPTTVRIPPQASASIAALVQSAKIDAYQTYSDFIRDAVIHRLHYIGEALGDLTILQNIRLQMMLSEEVTAQKQRDDYASLMSLIDQRLTDYIQRNQRDEARQYIKNALSKVDGIPLERQADFEEKLNGRLNNLY